MVAVVEDFYRTTDVDALVTDERVAAEIAQMRTEDSQFVNPDGSLEDAGFGTEHHNADQEHQSAVSRIINAALSSHLTAHGITGSTSSLSYGGEAQCPGADW